MNKFWEHGYKGLSLHFTIGSRACWKSSFTKTLWQLSLGYVQFCVFWYDQPAAWRDHTEVKP